MANVEAKRAGRRKRHLRIRRKISGTPSRPRLVVFRSLRNIYAQVIDDTAGSTLVAAGTDSQELKGLGGPAKTEAARAVGRLVAEKALAAGIKQVSLDRGGYKFHGRVKALAEAAREAGLGF